MGLVVSLKKPQVTKSTVMTVLLTEYNIELLMQFISRKIQFWQCQIAAWRMVATINFLLKLPDENFDVVKVGFGNICIFVLGVLCTLVLRALYNSHNVIEKRRLHIIGHILVYSLLSTIVMTFTLLGIISLIYHGSVMSSLTSLNNIAANIISIFMTTLIWSCAYVGYHLLQRWKRAESEKYALQFALKEAELNTLMGQINPHFMFNSLNNIRALILEDVTLARKSITQLSNILRYSLQADRHTTISLAKELKNIHEFIAISTIQYEDRLCFKCDICEQALSHRVPPMMIQMLIENAIKHGISEQKGGGTLNLTIKVHNNTLLVTVTNPGSLTNKGTTQNSTQIGVKNIKKRLALLFGLQASFKLTEDSGTVTACLVLPLTQDIHSEATQ